MRRLASCDSRRLLQHKAEYYRLLRGVTERGEWEAWLLFILTGVEEAANWTTSRILAVRDLFDETLARCRAKLPAKVYSKELVELVFTQPYCKIQFLVDAFKLTDEQALKITRRITGRARFFQRALELTAAK